MARPIRVVAAVPCPPPTLDTSGQTIELFAHLACPANNQFGVAWMECNATRGCGECGSRIPLRLHPGYVVRIVNSKGDAAL